MAKKSAAPVALGSKEIPEGSPNCLEVIGMMGFYCYLLFV